MKKIIFGFLICLASCRQPLPPCIGTPVEIQQCQNMREQIRQMRMMNMREALR